MNNSVSKKIIKKAPVEEWKSFRLFDFETSDRVFEFSSDSDSDSTDSDCHPRKRKPKTFVVQMFGINEIGETVSITIPDFKPFFYIQVGSQWTEKEHIELVQEIKKQIGSYWASGILNSRLEKHSDLYRFNGSQQVFVRLSFQNTAVLNQVKNLWFHSWVEGEDRRKPQSFYFPKDQRNPQRTLLRLFESNIPPLLRCFHIHDISPSGWINIPINRVEKPLDPQTTCTYEYICKISQLKAQPEKETGVPYKICSFDIEASSSHGQFPLPIKNYRSTAVQIFDTFTTHIGDRKTMSQQKKDELLSKLILSAFGFKRFDGIDSIFPKKQPTQLEVQEAIQLLLKNDVSIPKDDGKLNDLLSIDQIYKKTSIIADITNNDENYDDGPTDYDDDTDNQEETPVVMTQSFSSWLAEPSVANRDTKINVLNRRMTALFPALEGDKITFIGSTFVLQGNDLPYKNHCLTLGNCGPVEGAEIQCCSTETELLLAWTDLIQKENPDIIIGYNIFGFDYDFMFRRAQENDCAEAFMRLSRLRGHISCKKNEKTEELSLDQKKIVIASGPFDMKYFNMIGRFQIDLYTYFRREFNLSSYKLDDVAGEYICDKINKIEENDEGNTVIYSKNLKGLQVGDYVHLMTVAYTTEYLNSGQKYPVVFIETKGKDKRFVVSGKINIPELDKTTVMKWGLAKDDVSPQDIFRMSNGTLEERAKVAKYCIQDCNIVQQLLMKIDVLTGYNEMARICSVPMKFLVFRGQGIKLTSCMAKFCRLRNTLMPDLTAVEEDVDANYDYEGAIVLPPKCGMYIDDPVACVDYSSLYPTIIISNNLSQDSKVWVKEYDIKGELIKFHKENAHYDLLPNYDYIDIEYDNFTKLQGGKKAITGKTVCRFAQFPNDQKGIIPSILEDILVARKKTRKMAEAETDDFMKNILDKRQLAYKVTANSIYGQCGSRTSTFYDKDIAACTTATGRKMILYAKKMVEDVYGNHRFTHSKYGDLTTSAEYIYGDTDSVFMTFHIRKVNDDGSSTPVVGKQALEITIELAKEVARLCSMNLKKPMELTYEKTLMPFIILSKKRYVGMLYEDDTEHCKLKFMGLSIKRRDCCDYLKDVFGGVLNKFLYNTENSSKLDNVKSAMDFLQSCLKQLVLGQVPIEKLTITKSLRDYYKTPQQIAHWVLAQRIAERDPGNKPRPGDRMKYAFIVVDQNRTGKKLLQGDKIETPVFIHQTQAKLDYHHYITNQLMKPLLQLFGLIVEEILMVQGKKMDLLRYKKDLDNLHKTVFKDGLSEDTLLEIWTKRKEKLSETYAHDCLFRSVLTDISNRQKGLKNITQFF